MNANVKCLQHHRTSSGSGRAGRLSEREARARSSCNIINNLFSGHIFIPHAIITLSLSLPPRTSERPHAWLYALPMCTMYTNNETYRRKMNVESKERISVTWSRINRERKKKRTERSDFRWCGLSPFLWMSIKVVSVSRNSHVPLFMMSWDKQPHEI